MAIMTIVSGGRLSLDAGNMFGPVPRVVWQTRVQVDERHRLSMDTNCFYAELGSHRVLIDTGYGGKASEKQRDLQGLEKGEPIVQSLAQIGVDPSSITIVVLSHLHFDHAGGCTRRQPGGSLELVFPNAKHFVQKTEWEDAIAARPELLGSYFEEDFLPIEEAGLIEFVTGDAELIPGLGVRLLGGHTRGMQVVDIEPGGQSPVVYLADLVPTTHHLKTFWTISYDQFPLNVRRRKPVELGRAVDRQARVLLCHDTQTRWAYLRRDLKQEFVVDDAPRPS